MPLFHVQDPDRPMWVVAMNWQEAIDRWRDVIASENDGEVGDEPDGIQFVCDDDDLIWVNAAVGDNE